VIRFWTSGFAMNNAGIFICKGVVAMDVCCVELTMVERRLHDGRCEL
jgi:hypothetical protein